MFKKPSTIFSHSKVQKLDMRLIFPGQTNTMFSRTLMRCKYMKLQGEDIILLSGWCFWIPILLFGRIVTHFTEVRICAYSSREMRKIMWKSTVIITRSCDTRRKVWNILYHRGHCENCFQPCACLEIFENKPEIKEKECWKYLQTPVDHCFLQQKPAFGNQILHTQRKLFWNSKC